MPHGQKMRTEALSISRKTLKMVHIKKKKNCWRGHDQCEIQETEVWEEKHLFLMTQARVSP